VLLDDTSGSEAIRLRDKTGNEVVLSSSGIALTAAAGKTISLTAQGGTIELTANEVQATADSTVSVKANASASVEGSGELSLRGGKVGVQGSGLIQAQAPMIQLN
jgi:hypothetical protein